MSEAERPEYLEMYSFKKLFVGILLVVIQHEVNGSAIRFIRARRLFANHLNERHFLRERAACYLAGFPVKIKNILYLVIEYFYADCIFIFVRRN